MKTAETRIGMRRMIHRGPITTLRTTVPPMVRRPRAAVGPVTMSAAAMPCRHCTAPATACAGCEMNACNGCAEAATACATCAVAACRQCNAPASACRTCEMNGCNGCLEITTGCGG
ncbi:hypothetical protein ACN20G_09975 [Streptomyces sp. BI20]|uniref:hypothetical protein n=1 Tax=Streptomyces sp. BI20 TaxID=3403460 RepID=UPI003C713F57